MAVILAALKVQRWVEMMTQETRRRLELGASREEVAENHRTERWAAESLASTSAQLQSPAAVDGSKTRIARSENIFQGLVE